MPVKTDQGTFACKVCGEEFPREPLCYSHEKLHDIVYVPFLKGDLYRLIQYIYTGDPNLLTPTLIDTIMTYNTRVRDE